MAVLDLCAGRRLPRVGDPPALAGIRRNDTPSYEVFRYVLETMRAIVAHQECIEAKVIPALEADDDSASSAVVWMPGPEGDEGPMGMPIPLAATYQPRASVFLSSATQSVANITDVKVTFDGETSDVGPMHDNVTNNTRVTIPSGGGGTYVLSTGIEFAVNSTGFRQVRFLKNNATILALTNQQAITVASTVTRPTLTHTVDLVATDYVEVQVYQDSGAALNINGGSAFQTWFTAVKVA